MLPTADDAIAAVRAAGPDGLDQWAPDIDREVDTAAIAGWLGIGPRSVHRARSAGRWPDAVMVGRTPTWSYRTVAEYRASRTRGMVAESAEDKRRAVNGGGQKAKH